MLCSVSGRHMWVLDSDLSGLHLVLEDVSDAPVQLCHPSCVTLDKSLIFFKIISPSVKIRIKSQGLPIYLMLWRPGKVEQVSSLSMIKP